MKNPLVEQKIEEARRIVARLLPAEALPGACLYHAVAIQQVLPGAVLCAGSYSWRFTTHDDGSNPTHFSCIFDQTAQRLAQAILASPERIQDLAHFPEMHVFNVYMGKVLDISTLYIPQFAQRTGGFTFEHSLRPPPYLWDVPVHKNKRWLYAPSRLATELAKAAAATVVTKLYKGA